MNNNLGALPDKVTSTYIRWEAQRQVMLGGWIVFQSSFLSDKIYDFGFWKRSGSFIRTKVQEVDKLIFSYKVGIV